MKPKNLKPQKYPKVIGGYDPDSLDKRVYCCNCSNFVRAIYDDYVAWDDYCRAKTGRVIENNVSGDYPERFHIKVDDLNYPNRDGKCKLYVKKWWKWWVK